MITQNAQLVANSIMAEAIENWLETFKPTKYHFLEYHPEELVARGQLLPLAEEI